MISHPDRQVAVRLINAAGARLAAACAVLGIDRRTYRRWHDEGEVCADGRPLAQRPPPSNKLSDAIVAACNTPEHASLPPSQIVPRLADAGQYLASESTFYRVLHDAQQLNRRGRARAPSNAAKPRHQSMVPRGDLDGALGDERVEIEMA